MAKKSKAKRKTDATSDSHPAAENVEADNTPSGSSSVNTLNHDALILETGTLPIDTKEDQIAAKQAEGFKENKNIVQPPVYDDAIEEDKAKLQADDVVSILDDVPPILDETALRTDNLDITPEISRDTVDHNVKTEHLGVHALNTAQGDTTDGPSKQSEPSHAPVATIETTARSETATNGEFDHESIAKPVLKEALESHQQEMARLVSENEKLSNTLARVEEEKLQVEAQYKSLFGKVTQMKTTLGARLKQDAEELSQNRTTIEELENQVSVLNETVLHMQEKIVESAEDTSSVNKEKSSLLVENKRLKNVVDEIQASLTTERSLRTIAEEKNMLTTAEWENLAIEERTARDSLRDRIHDLEEQLAAQNNAYENMRSIVEQDNQTITKLKQQTYEMQDNHEKELQQSTADLQTSIDALENQKKTFEARIDLMRTHSHNVESDLEKLRPYEQEVKEKSLLIGKLRHEAVILNEHLTKALRLLKRGSSNDSVDRQLLNNLLLSFFQLPRQDSKRFEVLKILASVLAWDDVQKEQAGLIRPGSGMTPLAPMSPNSFRSPPASPNLSRGAMSRRTSGAIQLQAADFMGPNRESMSDLWINFLQTEAAMNAADAVETS